MAEILSPGVFIEEIPSSVQVIQPVSTSNMGIVGFTKKGPTDTATLVTSFEDYTRKFGDIDSRSFMGLTMAAYFSNGGRRAFVVRVVPSDAVASDANIRSQTTDQTIDTGDGSTATITATAATSLLKDNNGASPLVGNTMSMRWRSANTTIGAPVTSEATMQRDGATPLVAASGVQAYEGIIDPASLVAFDEGLHRIVPGTVTFEWNSGARSIAVAATDDIATGTSADGDVVIDHKSGRFSLFMAANPLSTDPITVDYTPAVGDLGDRAFGTIGTGANGTVNILADAVGAGMNSWTVEVINPVPVENLTLSATINSGVIEVTLATVGGGASLDGTKNTATLVAGVVDALTGVTAAALGTGADSFTAAEGPNLFSGGRNAAPDWTITDDGAGVLNTSVALTGAGTLSYSDGSYSFTCDAAITQNTSVSSSGVDTTAYTAVPHDQAPILATYQIDAWEMNPVSAGAWGNDLRISLTGNDDFFTASTGTYSRFNMNVSLENSIGSFEILETYEELVFDDPTSVNFWADVVNELSDLISVEEPGGNEAPLQLNSVSRSNIIAGGDEDAGTRNIVTTLTNAPVTPRTVSITYTDSNGDAKTITDDGNGNFIGDIDATGNNTITYANGDIDVTVASAFPIDAPSLVTASYYTGPAESTHTEDFGDSTKGYEVGADGTFTPSTYGRGQFTSPLLITPKQGLYALNTIDELMQIVIPDFVGDEIVTGDLLDYAGTRADQPSGADRFILLQVPQGSDAQEAVDWFRFTLNRTSIHAALYWPWVRVADPLANGRPLTMPALGHIAGIYARTDSNKNVGKAPGGTVDGALRFLIGLETEPNQGERDFVYPQKINPLISSPQTGLAVWGVRTIYPVGQSEWRYINARRLFNFLEKSIFNATHWIVFENNGPGLWARISSQLNGFLTALFNEGLFAGSSPGQAFFVIVDSTNNTPESIELGQVIIDIGVAPNRPAEFVRFRFTQKALE